MSAPPSETLRKAIPDLEPTPEGRSRKATGRIVAGVAGGLVVAVLVATYALHSSRHETTDDAYTTGHIHNISSRVAGTVVEVAVDDNQFVKKGQVLARLDPRDFQVQVDKARADFLRAQADFDRARELTRSQNGYGAISHQEVDQMQANLAAAQAALDDAQDQLGYCTITAPDDGFVGDKTVETGNRLAVGTVLMSVVQDVWVVANYKETQVGRLRVVQPVSISVDEISGHVFRGRVDSFSPGSGSVFALLPPENATGNFTKIVQRVPVKIRLEAESVRGYERRLVPGLSVETDVTITGLR